MANAEKRKKPAKPGEITMDLILLSHNFVQIIVMETIIKIDPAELNESLLDKIRNLLTGRDNNDHSITIVKGFCLGGLC